MVSETMVGRAGILFLVSETVHLFLPPKLICEQDHQGYSTMPDTDETGVRRQNRMLPSIRFKTVAQLQDHMQMHKCIDMSKCSTYHF